MAKLAPVIGQWYRRPEGESFEVVAIDRDDRTIEIQYFDGTVEELDVDEWIEAEIEVTEAPEDWTGSLDVEPEDTENEFESEPGSAQPWVDPLQFVDRREATAYSEVDLAEADDAERY